MLQEMKELLRFVSVRRRSLRQLSSSVVATHPLADDTEPRNPSPLSQAVDEVNVDGVEPMYSVLEGEQRLRLRDDAPPGAHRPPPLPLSEPCFSAPVPSGASTASSACLPPVAQGATSRRTWARCRERICSVAPQPRGEGRRVGDRPLPALQQLLQEQAARGAPARVSTTQRRRRGTGEVTTRAMAPRHRDEDAE